MLLFWDSSLHLAILFVYDMCHCNIPRRENLLLLWPLRIILKLLIREGIVYKMFWVNNILLQVGVTDNLYTFMHDLWLQSAPIGELFWEDSPTVEHGDRNVDATGAAVGI